MSSKTTSTIIIAVFVFVFSVASLSFMVYHVNEQGKHLADQVETLEKSRLQEDAYYKLQKISEDTEQDRRLLQSYFLKKESNSIDFLNLVESLASNTGVFLKTDSLDVVPATGGGADWIKASFTFSSSRERVKNFTQVLETLPYVSRITSLKLSKMSESEWRAQVEMQVQILNHDK